MSTPTFLSSPGIYFGLLAAAFLVSCSSGNDNTSPLDTPVTVQAESSGNDDPANGIALETGGDSDSINSEPADSEPTDSELVDEGVTQDVHNNSDGASNEANTAGQQSDSYQTDAESPLPPITADNQRVSFGTAELLVDLVPNGGSYPAKFHRAGDKLYFWTVDTDPRFGACSWHWGYLDEDDKNIAFNLVAVHPETGAVAMNKQIMTLGDFADDPNSACAGYNGSVMQVYEQRWITPGSAASEQQFVLHFDSLSLGPDRVWLTDGSEDNTSLLATGETEERAFFEDNKVFFVGADGLSVSDTLAGNRRQLYEPDNRWFSEDVKRIVKSPARQATFEIRVGENRYQIWTYDLDTDEWDKKFSIKPDDNTYVHYETLLVDGQTLLSRGESILDGRSALGYSSNYGDVTSFEIVSSMAPSFSNTDQGDVNSTSSQGSNKQLYYSTTDFSADPQTTSVWSYREEQIKKLFSISEYGLQDKRVIVGQDGRIYVVGTKSLQQWPNYMHSLELWSYDPQLEKLTKLSKDDWYSSHYDHETPDESYVLRYLNTPDGLVFVNLKNDTGRELWFTDGTHEGTRLLADINPGRGNSDPQDFYHSGDAIYFSANDGTYGREPWMIPISR